MKINTIIEKRSSKIYLHITLRGVRFKICTDLTSTEPLLNGVVFPPSQRNHKAKTTRLARIIAETEEYLLRDNNKPIEVIKEHIREIATGKQARPKGHTTLVERIITFADTKHGSTGGIYKLTAKHVAAYDPYIALEDVDRNWIEKYYERQLQARKINSVAIDMRNIRAVFNWAINNKIIGNYPFRGFTIKTERTKHLFLPAEQIKILRDYKVEQSQEVYRDIFMLGFYLIGINISDLLELENKDYRFGRITYYRNKTHRLYDIKVEPEAEAIIEKYRGTKHVLRFVDEGCVVRTFNHTCNDVLKHIGEMDLVRNKRGAYRKKVVEPLFPDITWYTARRSWATIAAQLDIPKETIGKALGHSQWDNTITDIYINFDNRKIDEANRKVLDYIR